MCVDAAMSAQITKVDWPDSEIHTSASVRPWVYVENTGLEATRFHVQFAIQDSQGKWYTSGCWPTDIIKGGEDKVVWPYSVEVTSSMPRGRYNAKVVLYGDSCGGNELDSVVKQYAFIVS
jgi:hypothetical protein